MFSTGAEGRINSTVQLLDLCQKELAHYSHLMDTARMVQVEIKLGNMDEVFEILQAQDQEIGLINQLEAETAIYKAQVADYFGLPEFSFTGLRKVQGDGEVKVLLAVADQTFQILKELAEIVDVNQRLLQQKMAAVRSESQLLNRGQEANDAYLSKAPKNIEARFIDRKGV